MKRRTRRSVRQTWKINFKMVSYEEVIKVIYRKFIEPMVKNTDMSARDILNTWFATDSRSLYFGKADRAFLMPGEIKHPDTDQFYTPKEERRKVSRDNQITVRLDDYEPQFVDVEFNDMYFRMTPKEWELAKANITLVG